VETAQALKHFGSQRTAALACATMSAQSCHELWRALTCDFNGAVSALDRSAMVSDVFKRSCLPFKWCYAWGWSSRCHLPRIAMYTRHPP